MRLLSWSHAGLFSLTYYPPSTTPPYAILSHTWGPDEITYEDLTNGTGLQKKGYHKIRFCAEQAERDGLQHFWVDTCCINKSSDAELTESINSMFRWYSNASKCYAYLADVSAQAPRDHNQHDRQHWRLQFQRSRWFTRGWTLQELIAPATVDFFSQTGAKLGSRESLEPLICEITGIPAHALRKHQLHRYTTTEKMAWAQTRETTRPEDIAYSLLGIFDVQMPLIYGEGREKALKRLREEISKDHKGSQHEEFSVPFSLYDVPEIEHFVARERELAEIHEKLRSDGSRRVAVLHGLGGIGKTQLAIAYTKRHKDHYSAIFWVNIKDENSLKQSFTRIAHQIIRRHPSASHVSNIDIGSDPDETIASVKAWLSLPNNTRWLLVYDNYDNPKLPNSEDSTAIDIQKYLPEVYQGSVVITTRSSQVKIGHSIRMVKMQNIYDGLEILSATSKRKELFDDPDAVRLAEELDGLPLALATAGAYLEQTSTSFGSYLNLYRDSWARLQTNTPQLGSYADRTLYSTWQLSYDQIRQQNENSAALLRLWAYFDNQDIWLELLQSDHRHSMEWVREVTKDELSFTNTVRTLINYGLVEVDYSMDELTESRGYSVHSCVYSWITHVLNQERSIDLARYAIRCVSSHVYRARSDKYWLIERRLLQHALKYSYAVVDTIIKDEDTWIYRSLGYLYANQGKLKESEEMHHRVLRANEKILRIDHPSTIRSAIALGIVYRDSGKWKKAEETFKRALHSAEKALGPSDALTLAIISYLGALYMLQGMLKETKDVFQRALQSIEKAQSEHGLALNAMRALGDIYRNLNKLKEAEEMYQQVIQGGETSLGSNHISILETVFRLGWVFYEQGKMKEAEQMSNRALQGYEKVLGPNHRSTLNAVYCLGCVFYEQGKMKEAEEMLNRALQGYEKTLGPNHLATLNAGSWLDYVLCNQGKPNEAKEIFNRAL
ncbi:hypothetical protein F5B21DRAFT_487237 [Xylaria acuta]|nr:hypothetical protein F5B21DRAFT_487237 [Xylaria acuta]